MALAKLETRKQLARRVVSPFAAVKAGVVVHPPAAAVAGIGSASSASGRFDKLDPRLRHVQGSEQQSLQNLHDFLGSIPAPGLDPALQHLAVMDSAGACSLI